MMGMGGFKKEEPGARARLVRRVVFVVIGTLLGLVSGVALGSSQPRRYESTMQLLVGPVGADRSTLDAAGLLSRTYADLLSSRNAISRAAESLGVPVEAVDVSAKADDKSRVILLVVTGDDPSTPPRLATTLAADLIVLVEGSQQQPVDEAIDGPAPGQVRVLDDATDPALPVGRRSTLTVIGTSILGAGVGLALGSLAPRSRRRGVDRQHLELLGLDVISLQHVTRRRRRRLGRRRPVKQVANKLDEYELIFQQLLIKGIQRGPFRTMLFVPVTEDLEGDVAKLMAVLAQAGHRLSCSVELSDLDPDLRLLSAIDSAVGVEIVDPIDLDTESGVKRIASISESSDSKLLFLAAPAVGTSVRALTAVPAVDRIVLVVRSGQTERRDVRRLLDDLTRLNSRPAAVLELDRGELIMATSVVSSMGRLDTEVAVIGTITSPFETDDAGGAGPDEIAADASGPPADADEHGLDDDLHDDDLPDDDLHDAQLDDDDLGAGELDDDDLGAGELAGLLHDERDDDDLAAGDLDEDDLDDDESLADDVQHDDLEADDLEADDLEADDLEADDLEADDLDEDDLDDDDLEDGDLEDDDLVFNSLVFDDLVFDDDDPEDEGDDDLDAEDLDDGFEDGFGGDVDGDGDVEADGEADARSDGGSDHDPDGDGDAHAEDEDRIGRRSSGTLALFDDRRSSKL